MDRGLDQWVQIQALSTRHYTCGYCGTSLSSERGWLAQRKSGGVSVAHIYICHNCLCPTFFDGYTGQQAPGVSFGNDVQDILEKTIIDLYSEARKAIGVNSYTASVLCCRKLLMHIAVSKGAEANKNFQYYVEYLASQNYIPPDARDWVDHIRKKGNEANHEIVIMKKEDAEELISFIEMLLKIIFEFPAVIKRRVNTP